MTEERNNLVLIGMPSAGKSTLGVVLAKILGYDFVDTDLLIQRREGARLEEIIAREGLDGFLRIEEEICRSLQVSHTVIATGGSAVYGQSAMEHLRQIALVLYLKVEWEELKSRLHDIRGRGVVLREGQTLDELYQERSILYEQYADLVVEERGLTMEETVRAICDALKGESFYTQTGVSR